MTELEIIIKETVRQKRVELGFDCDLQVILRLPKNEIDYTTKVSEVVKCEDEDNEALMMDLIKEILEDQGFTNEQVEELTYSPAYESLLITRRKWKNRTLDFLKKNLVWTMNSFEGDDPNYGEEE